MTTIKNHPDNLLQYQSISEKQNLIKSGDLNLRENIARFLEIIESRKGLNAFNSLNIEDIYNRADAVQSAIISGKHGRLAGAVFSIKDVLSFEGLPLTCSSKILENFKPVYTATAVRKILEEDGIIIGKTNCDEFAMGSSNENSTFGPVLHPKDTSKVPGGSSGGAAVSVAAGMCDVALGSDTGGSVRQPAAFCGILGLKPTYSRVSRYGLTAFASSFDTIGVFGTCAADVALTLDVISGFDEKDSTSSNVQPSVSSLQMADKKKYSIGLPKEYFTSSLSSEVRDSINITIEQLKSAGHQFVEISLPHTEYCVAAYYILCTAEASSNLSRFDGVRYGFSARGENGIEALYKESRTQGFGAEVKRRILMGTYVLSSGYYDAYYRKAQKVRRVIKNDFDNVFKNVDVLLTPTTPNTAFGLGEKSGNPLEMYLSDIYTTSANLAGVPALSVPASQEVNNLPVGVQLIASHFKENILLAIAAQLEKINRNS